MAEAPSVTIPDKPAFKASEVCELAQIQPYVLRSWESEFPELGLSKTPGGPRINRRVDVERVLRIRDLVFTEGLTLAGVRRRFDAEQPPPQDDLFSFVAEVQAAQAKAAQAHAERRTSSAEAEPPAPTRRPANADTPPSTRHAPNAAGAAPALTGPSTLPGPGETDDVSGAAHIAAVVPAEARATLVQLKHEMRSLLDLLGGSGNAVVQPPPQPPPASPRRSRRS